MRQRKNVTALSDGEKALLRSAVGALKASADPAKNYAHWAAIHAASCPHRCEVFLPWHRAYILQYENALREAVKSDQLTLPFWDWTATRQVPDVFADPVNNPLWCDRYTDATRPNITLPTTADRDSVLAKANFIDFGGTGSGVAGVGCRGSLESIHDCVHLWTGPAMSTATTAACDPLFWSHHAYVDKLWAQWQPTHAGQTPRNLAASLPGLDVPATVGDMLDIAALGYEYVEATNTQKVPAGRIESRFEFKPRLTVPLEFAQAKLVLHGLHVMEPMAAPNRVEVLVAGTLATSSCLFGLHAMDGQHHVRMGDPEPCFPPVVPNHLSGDCISLEVTAAMRRFMGEQAPDITVVLRRLEPQTATTVRVIPVLNADRVELTFRG